ncbi:hypothetical protein LLY42_25735 [Pseudomonas frederiksbergensis]|nr:hypothetical protein LLY42_25735 [Pseudomonas frederiksbergensis]
MDDIITQLGHWLSEVHGSGRHTTTLALQLIFIATAITGAIKARDYAQKRKQLKERQTTTLATDSLSMTLLSSEGDMPVKYVATLLREDEGYRLEIMKSSGATQAINASERFKSLDEVENHLRQNTQFLLSDFK